jgi:pyrroloquinoline quinone (PQQ) biosynthesis protein C
MSEEEFQDRLVDTVVRTRLNMDAGYAFPEELDEVQGRLYHATFLKHFSFFAWKFPSWLMEVASRCPYQDVRRTVIEDCVDEEVADPDAGGRCHIDVLYEEAEACGISREEIAATQATPIVLACVHALENFSRTLGWETSFAALAALEIGSSEPAVKLRNKLLSESLTPEQIARGRSGRESKSLSERTGLPEEKLVFAAIHAYKDQFHGGGELKLLVKYGTNREIQESMLWAAKAGLEVFCVMREEIDRIARAAVGLQPGERVLVKAATA